MLNNIINAYDIIYRKRVIKMLWDIVLNKFIFQHMLAYNLNEIRINIYNIYKMPTLLNIKNTLSKSILADSWRNK